MGQVDPDLVGVLTPLPAWVTSSIVCPGYAREGLTLVLCLLGPGYDLKVVQEELAQRPWPPGHVFGWGDVGDPVPPGYWLNMHPLHHPPRKR